ncbi:MAG: hypothetical protein M1840_004290 [Geoglossum simile]|nr:MAG: hypothetical protein M1840_004290 [Geoglossum simile]
MTGTTFNPLLGDDPKPLNPPNCLKGNDILKKLTYDEWIAHEEKNCMISRAPRQRLDTLESRKISLTTHVNHKDWTRTPYISFTSSAAAVQELAGRRSRRRGAQTLTALDPNFRIADGLPILDIAAEMDHYGIPDPYGRSNRYYRDHYLCLWEVTEREIIGHWQWDDLVANKQWYYEIVLPAFREHGRKTASRSADEETLVLSAAMNELSCMFLISRKLPSSQITRQVVSGDRSDPKCLFDGDSDKSSEEVTCDLKGGSGRSNCDTDDEAEEANAAGDMIKITEGD